MSSITFTTKDGENNIGNPMVLGFTSNKTETAFSETYDLELPPPPPPPLTNQLPDTSQYNTQLFISIENKSAYEYYIPEVITSSLSLQFVVRKAGGGLVTFTYNNSQIGQIFSVLEIVGESGVSIDLLTTTDNTGVTIDGTTNTVTLDSLAHGEFYTMNVQKFVEGPSEMIVDVVAGWNMFGTSDTTTISENDSSNPVILSSEIYWFDGSAYESNNAYVMSPHKGYWIKCSSAGNIKLTF